MVIITMICGIPYLLIGMTLWAMLFTYEGYWTRWLALIPFTLLWFPLAVLILILDKAKLL